MEADAIVELGDAGRFGDGGAGFRDVGFDVRRLTGATSINRGFIGGNREISIVSRNCILIAQEVVGFIVDGLVSVECTI